MTPRPPTDAELAVLRVLWARGRATVREVHAALDDGTAYTTTLTTMQRMVDKGLLHRDTSQRSHVFQATEPAEATRGSLVARLADRAFAGSGARLAMAALAQTPSDPDELAALRAMLDAMETP